MISAYPEHMNVVLCEDTLVAGVFDFLLCLPDETFARLLVDEFNTHDSEFVLGPLLDHTFWPKWSAAGTLNAVYVEPDIVLEFEMGIILVEAKRDDVTVPSEEQLLNEIYAFRNEYNTAKQLLVLCIGGIPHSTVLESISNATGVPVRGLNWFTLHSRCQNLLAKENEPHLNRVIQNTLKVFDDHELSRPLRVDQLERNYVFNRFKLRIGELRKWG